MATPLGILQYAGRPPAARRSFLATCWRVLVTLLLCVILLVVVTVRAALLLTGYTCVVAGTVLLMLGGRRDAAQRLARWRARSGDLVYLWRDDLLRPLRHWRSGRAADRGRRDGEADAASPVLVASTVRAADRGCGDNDADAAPLPLASTVVSS